MRDSSSFQAPAHISISLPPTFTPSFSSPSALFFTHRVVRITPSDTLGLGTQLRGERDVAGELEAAVIGGRGVGGIGNENGGDLRVVHKAGHCADGHSANSGPLVGHPFHQTRIHGHIVGVHVGNSHCHRAFRQLQGLRAQGESKRA